MIRESGEFIPNVITQTDMVCAVSFAWLSAYVFITAISASLSKHHFIMYQGSSFQLFNQALFGAAAKSTCRDGGGGEGSR